MIYVDIEFDIKREIMFCKKKVWGKYSRKKVEPMFSFLRGRDVLLFEQQTELATYLCTPMTNLVEGIVFTTFRKEKTLL